MEAKSEGDECRWTYEVVKVLLDKRKGTSVWGGAGHDLLLELHNGSIDGLFSFPKLVFHCDERSVILVVKRLLRREDGKIKVKVEVHVIRSAIIIKSSSHGFP